MTDLDRLIEAVEAGHWPGTNFVHQVSDSLGQKAYAAYDGSLDAAKALHDALLPGWGWRIGECHVSDDAAVFPNFHCPAHGERLKRELDEGVDWFDLTDVDQRPAGNPARAWLIAILIAYRAIIQEDAA